MSNDERARFEAGIKAWCDDVMAFEFEQIRRQNEQTSQQQEQERRHGEAMANYAAWQEDRKRRGAERDATIEAYHASLREAERHAGADDEPLAA
jgi:hypothetical protein